MVNGFKDPLTQNFVGSRLCRTMLFKQIYFVKEPNKDSNYFSRNAPKCTERHSTFQNISRGSTPGSAVAQHSHIPGGCEFGISVPPGEKGEKGRV